MHVCFITRQTYTPHLLPVRPTHLLPVLPTSFALSHVRPCVSSLWIPEIWAVLKAGMDLNSSEEHYANRNSLTKSTRTRTKHMWEDSEWSLSAVVSLSFHLRSAFTPRFTFQRLLTRCDKTARSMNRENVARAACTLWSQGSWLG